MYTRARKERGDMATQSGREMSTRVSRIIKAPRRAIYEAFLDPAALVSWLPPRGMTGRIFEFDAREGGSYRMALTHAEPNHSARGKTSEHTDIVRGRFLELIPDQRIALRVEFQTTDPAFAGAMTVTWTLSDVPSGTDVAVHCENAPAGIRPSDHETGMRSSLENLAAFTE
jgi:uncharacterized protein YndB with AHSA1/START domain